MFKLKDLLLLLAEAVMSQCVLPFETYGSAFKIDVCLGMSRNVHNKV